jgi:hypothetical protein
VGRGFSPRRALTQHHAVRISWQHHSAEAAYGVVPNVSKLRAFGCVALATLPHLKKFDEKAVRATKLGHIGYGKYRLLLPGPD